MKAGRKFVIGAMLLLMAVGGFAQEKYFYLAWDSNIPLSSRDWIGGTSTRGIKAGYRVFVSPMVSVGLDLASSAYDEYFPTTTFENPTGAITTDYFNYLYSNSAVISGQYNRIINKAETLYAYGGLGLGANLNEYVMYYNIYEDRERKWGFLMRHEVGLFLRFGGRRSMAVMASIHYDFSTNDSERFDYSNFSAVGFQLGIIFLD